MGGAEITEMNPTWLRPWLSERSGLRGGGWKHQVSYEKSREGLSGDIQGGFLEEGIAELASKTDRFDNEDGRGDSPGTGVSLGTNVPPPSPSHPTHRAPEPPHLDTATLSLALGSSDTH